VGVFLIATVSVLGGLLGVKKLHSQLHSLHAMLFFFFITSAFIVVGSVLKKVPTCELSIQLLTHSVDSKQYLHELLDGPATLKRDLFPVDKSLGFFEFDTPTAGAAKDEYSATQNTIQAQRSTTHKAQPLTQLTVNLFPTILVPESAPSQTSGTLNNNFVMWYQQYAAAEIDYVYTWTLTCFCLFCLCAFCL